MIIMPGAIFCCLLNSCLYAVLWELCYVCTPTFIATIANMDQRSSGNYELWNGILHKMLVLVIGILKIDCLKLFVVVYKLIRYC